MTPNNVSSSAGLFAQLAPLVAKCAVLLTVSGEGEGRLRVNVCPRQRDQGENDSLTTPLSVTGTPEELDASLVEQVRRFVELHDGLRTTLGVVSAEIAAAEKKAREEGAAKAARRHSKAAAGETAKADEGGKPESRPTLPETMSLFDPPPAGSRSVSEPIGVEDEGQKEKRREGDHGADH